MENRTKVKAVARANAFHGLFQAILQPEGVLTMDEIAERWADYARIERGFAKLQLLRSSRYALTQPDALGAGAFPLRRFAPYNGYICVG